MNTIAEQIITIRGTLNEVSERCIELKREGYTINTSDRLSNWLSNWPFFWLPNIYIVQLSKPVILDVRLVKDSSTEAVDELKKELGL